MQSSLDGQAFGLVDEGTDRPVLALASSRQCPQYQLPEASCRCTCTHSVVPIGGTLGGTTGSIDGSTMGSTDGGSTGAISIVESQIGRECLGWGGSAVRSVALVSGSR